MNELPRSGDGNNPKIYFAATYGEKHHGDGEGDGGQHGQSDDQQNHVGLEHLGVGVQHLGLHVCCGQMAKSF